MGFAENSGGFLFFRNVVGASQVLISPLTPTKTVAANIYEGSSSESSKIEEQGNLQRSRRHSPVTTPPDLVNAAGKLRKHTFSGGLETS